MVFLGEKKNDLEKRLSCHDWALGIHSAGFSLRVAIFHSLPLQHCHRQWSRVAEAAESDTSVLSSTRHPLGGHQGNL